MNDYYISPSLNKEAFNCAVCGVYSKQYWSNVFVDQFGQIDSVLASRCSHCQVTCFWGAKEERIYYPETNVIFPPNDDMPEIVANCYKEAAKIAQDSPRGSAALLRLALQYLCVELECESKNLNQAVGELVGRGLPEKVAKALDAVRVIGNEAVHPGTIDLDDNPEIVVSLFRLINLICDQMISSPKHVDEVFNLLPLEKRSQIEARDLRAKTDKSS